MKTIGEIKAAIWALSPDEQAEVIRRVDMTLIGENYGSMRKATMRGTGR